VYEDIPKIIQNRDSYDESVKKITEMFLLDLDPEKDFEINMSSRM
jgi:hypothetical protein